jgi:type 1 glutamine amidotransferase
MYTAVAFSYGIMHPSLLVRRLFHRQILSKIPSLRIITPTSFRDFAAQTYIDADLWVLYYHRKQITPQQTQNIISYLERGGAILAIHSAAASFKSSPDYEKIIGGKFIQHGPIKRYTIKPTCDCPNELKLQPIQVKDELYFHQFESANTILYHTTVNGTLEPILWMKDHHPGKIMYFAPGHLSATFRNTHIQDLLSKAINFLLSKGQ